MEKKKYPIKEGEYALCWYYRIPSMPREGLELYYCKVIKMNSSYATCELYFGDKFNPYSVKGTFNDVCVADLVEFDGSPIPSKPEPKQGIPTSLKSQAPTFRYNLVKEYSETDIMIAFCAGFEKGKGWEEIPPKEMPYVFSKWLDKFKKHNNDARHHTY